MTTKKKSPVPITGRRNVRLERQIAAVEAQIARLEKDPQLGLATRDHFLLWKRPALFMTWCPATLQ
jgi:hypothetical protein